MLGLRERIRGISPAVGMLLDLHPDVKPDSTLEDIRIILNELFQDTEFPYIRGYDVVEGTITRLSEYLEENNKGSI